MRIFTDGSRTDTSSGAGIYSADLNIRCSIPLGERTRAFQAEIFAILTAAEAVVERGIHGEDIVILTDSQAAIQALSSTRRASLLVREFCERLETLSARNDVLLTWLPAHSGIDGNIEADELASEGSRKRLCGPQSLFGISNAYRRALVSRNAHNVHSSMWARRREGAHTKLFVPVPSRSVTRTILDYNRGKVGLFVNYLTGHSLNKHMHRLRIADSALCRLCLEEDENPSHILAQCPANVSARLDTFGFESLDLKELHRLNLKKVLHFMEDQLRCG